MNQKQEVPEILIVGAGPTGLTLAVFLANAGVPFRIVDPKPGPTQETRAVGVQARTLELFRLVGMTDRMLANGRVCQEVTLWSRGKIAAQVPLGQIGKGLSPHPYLFLLGQDETEQLLVERLGELGVQVEWGVEFVGLNAHEDRVEVTLEKKSPPSALPSTIHDPSTTTFRFVCGCDGARSPVRNAIGLDFPGGTYSRTFFVADVEAHGNVVPGNLNGTFFEGQFIAMFPLRANDRYRLIGILPEGIEPKTATIDSVKPEVERTLKGTITDTRWFSVYHVHHRVADHFQVGRVFLLGDAGHVHSPVGGQGMNTGIGDAINLSWKLAEVIDGASEALLGTYEEERIPFARTLVKTTDRGFELIVSKSALARFTRMFLAPKLLGFFLRFRAIQKRFFGVISQTRISYPEGRLSGRLGKIRAGERMPWIPGLHERQANNGWWLFCLGIEPPEAAKWCKENQIGITMIPMDDVIRKAGYGEGILLIRPDSYVGFCSTRFSAEELSSYLRTIIGRPIQG